MKNTTICRISHIKTDEGKSKRSEMSESRKEELEKVEAAGPSTHV